MQVVDKDGNIFGGGIEVTSSNGKPKSLGSATPTANNYICQIGLSVDQNLSSGADALLDFIDMDDPNDWYDPSAKIFSPTVAGYYHIDFSVWFETSPVSTGQYNIQVRKNGSTIMISQQPTINNGTGQSLTSSKIIYFNGSSDYIDFTAYQSTGSTRKLHRGTDSSGTYASIFLLAM